MAKAKKIKPKLEENAIPPETETRAENTETVTITVVAEEVKPEVKVEDIDKPPIWNKRTGR